LNATYGTVINLTLLRHSWRLRFVLQFTGD